MGTLDALFAPDPIHGAAAHLDQDVVEAFIGRCLHEAGVWPSPRTSDGVPSVRTIEQGPMRVRLCGRIWEINQTLHSFWLDVERDCAAPERVTWTLYFDVDSALGVRVARTAVDVIQDPGDIRWLVTLTGSENGLPTVSAP